MRFLVFVWVVADIRYSNRCYKTITFVKYAATLKSKINFLLDIGIVKKGLLVQNGFQKFEVSITKNLAFWGTNKDLLNKNSDAATS